MLAVATVQKLGMIEILIAFGTEKDLHYVPAHKMSALSEIAGTASVSISDMFFL